MNGRCFDKSIGYWKVKAPGHPAVKHLKEKHQYVLEHRLVMEKMIGRYLRSDEFVLHLNGDRVDNDPDNLVIGDSNSQNKVHKRVVGYVKVGGDRKVFINKKYL